MSITQPQSDFGHWTVLPSIVPEGFFGFIYRITNLETGRCYIGKKQARTIKKLRPLKGQKRGRRKEVETDWKSYTGSSNELNSDISTLGKDKFKFEIIKFCSCKWELSYQEASLQFEERVLLNPDKYYNSIINLRINKAPKDILLNESNLPHC